MLRSISKALNIETGEELQVYLLLLLSLFLGIFVSAFDLGATSLFLSHFDPAYLSKVFIVSGLVGIILSIGYGKLQIHISFRRLALINQFIITGITFAVFAGFFFIPGKWLAFSVMILMGPLNAIAQLGFWGLAGRLFQLRQAKRLYGLIGSGQIFGIIVVSFLIPILLRLLPGTEYLIAISGVSLFLGLIVVFVIIQKFSSSLIRAEMSVTETKSVSYITLLKDKYLFSIASLVVFFMLAAFLIYGSFLKVVKDNYPTETSAAEFLGMFTGSVMIFSFLIKTFVFSRITNTYGLRVALLITPIVTSIFIFAAMFVGKVFGYMPDNPDFILFFMMIALSRLFNQSLSMAIQSPAIKILYQPLPSAIRYDIQAKIDGVVNEFACVFSGVILLVLGMMDFFRPIHVIYLLGFIATVWIWFVFKTYKEYQGSLRKSLEAGSSKDTNKNVKKGVLPMIEHEFNSQHPDKIIYSMELASVVQPVQFEKWAISSLQHPSAQIRKYALDKIELNKLVFAIPTLQERLALEKDGALKKQTSELLSRLYLSQEQGVTIEYLETLVRSRSVENRLIGARLVGQLATDDAVMLLIELLRDIEPVVRVASISAVARSQRKECFSYLTDNLSQKQYRKAAYAAIVSIGEPIVPTLESAFYKIDSHDDTLYVLVRLLGEIGGQQAFNVLLSKVDYPDQQLVKEVLVAMHRCDIRVAESKVNKIHQAIERVVANIMWDLAALQELDRLTEHEYLSESLSDQLKENQESLFLFLGLIYDPLSLKKIQENLDTGTQESIGYAIELLDLFIAEELKPIIFPVLEDLPVAEKIKALSDHFPRNTYSGVELLLAIMNRDFHSSNRWVKASAIYTYGQQESISLTNDLIANAFHPDKLIREVAMAVIYKVDPAKFQDIRSRLSISIQSSIDVSLFGPDSRKQRMVIEKVLLLRRLPVFKALSWNTLIDLSFEFVEIQAKQGQELIHKSNKGYALVLCIDAEVELRSQTTSIWKGKAGDVAGEMMLLDSDDQDTNVTVSKEGKLLLLQRTAYFDLLTLHDDFAKTCIDLIKLRFKRSIFDEVKL